jgi:PAS domain S-box-containing protein
VAFLRKNVVVRKMFRRFQSDWYAMTNEPTATQESELLAAGPVAAETSELPLVRPPQPATLDDALDLLHVETARRAQAEEALREIEERFRQLSEHAGRFLWLSDPQSDELLYVSPGYEQIWARTREASYPSPQQWRAGVTGRRRSRSDGEQIYEVAAPDGAVRWIRDRVFPIRDTAGHVVRMLGIAEDITDAKTAQDALRLLEGRWRALVTACPDLVVRLRRDGTILDSKAGTDARVLPENALAGKNVKQLLPASLAADVMKHLAAAFKSREPQVFSCQYLLPDEVRDFEAHGVISGEDEVIAIVRDVTDRKRLEREILEVSSREQQRIGQDLHDSLGQHLTGITFLAKVLERKLAPERPEEAKEIAEIGRLVMQALAQTRNLARGLVPAELERDGLVGALEELASSVERMCKVRCKFSAHEGLSVQDNVLATQVFRIAQEAINNACKHAQAKQIDVSLRSVNGGIELCVTDDGIGFSPEAKRDGLGLRIMHYRARRIGGSLDIKTQPKGGTRVTCAFRNRYESN